MCLVIVERDGQKQFDCVPLHGLSAEEVELVVEMMSLGEYAPDFKAKSIKGIHLQHLDSNE